MKEKTMKVSGFFIAGLVLVLFAASCSKSSTPNPNAAYLGTYFGTLITNGGSAPDTMVITAGSTSSSVIMLSKLGPSTYSTNGTSYTINGTVSGNTLTIASQDVQVYAKVDTITGTGGLIAPTLTINYQVNIPGTGNVNWNFTGTAQ